MEKKIFILWLALFGLSFVSKAQNGFKITGRLGGTLGGNLVLVANNAQGPVQLGQAVMVNGNFDFSRFYKEIAVSYGLGLRLDFDFFLLRFDTGMKAYNPQERGSRRWAITRPNLKDNFAWHFAVGYPF